MEKTTEKAALNNSEKAAPLTPKKAAPLTPKKANTTPASEVPLVICEDKSFRLNFLVSKKSSKDIDKLVTEILNHRITNPNSIMQYDLKTKRLSLSGEPPIVLPFLIQKKRIGRIYKEALHSSTLPALFVDIFQQSVPL